MKAMPTIRDLAQIAGVSTATISLALRDHPRIRLEVRKRIQQIAVEAGYRPNPLVAQLLAQLRTSKRPAFQSTLGILGCGNDNAFSPESPKLQTHRDWLEGCQERADALGYALDHFTLSETETKAERLIKILHARNIRGLLVIGPSLGHFSPTVLEPLWEYAAAVVIGVRPCHPPLNFASNDQFSTTLDTMRRLIEFGYTRPALCIHSDVDDWVENKFSAGFHVGQKGLAHKNHIPVFNFSQNSADAFKFWVNKHHPDVILTLHAGIFAWLKEMELDVPGDIGLVHLDKHPENTWAGMDQNNHQVGRAAVDLLIGQLHRTKFGIPSVQEGVAVAGTWSPGTTLRKQRSKSLVAVAHH